VALLNVAEALRVDEARIADRFAPLYGLEPTAEADLRARLAPAVAAASDETADSEGIDAGEMPVASVTELAAWVARANTLL
jgi:hypothetical protein